MTYPTTEAFKLNIRKAFNAAENGDEVIIVRLKQKYKLVRID